MIKLVNVIKKYQSRVVLHNISHQFPQSGLCVIYGQSGSGKTTLLNCLAGLIPFEGSIEIGHQRIETLNDDEKSKLRLSQYGFIFQDFKLFENETVLTNLLFPLETLYQLSKDKKLRKCKDLLSIVGLDNKEKQIVNKLSGGEKQRVAIARALINDPSVLLADEPPGALDEKNSIEIMNILKTISRKSLVIVVSHDQELTKKYADQIIEMENGEIKCIHNQNEDIHSSNLPILKNGYSNKKAKIPDSFLISHTYHNMKQKKARTLICYSMTSLGLIGVGLAFALSSTIATNIKDAYREIVDESSMMVSLKEKDNMIEGQYAASYYQVQEIKEKYDDYIIDVGITYYSNFEKFFPDINTLSVVRGDKYGIIPGFSARHINDFVWLDDIKSDIFPENRDELEDDEIIIGVDYECLREICFELQIERTAKSLSSYLKSNTVYLCFDFQNDTWAYQDQQLLRLAGFTLETDLTIYHSNHLWNEYMFEERMRFPISDAISIKDNLPWIMKKIYYLKTSENRDELLNLLLIEDYGDEFVFEIANEIYYPWLYYDKEMNERDRVLVFANTTNHFPLWKINYYLENDENLQEPIIGSNGGYFIYPESLMMGFSKTMYFSKNENDLISIIDHQTSHANDGFYQEDLPEHVLSGNYAKSLQKGIKFNVFSEKSLQIGNKPLSLDEIAISTSMFQGLGMKSLDEPLYVATSKKELLINGSTIVNDYVLIPLKITGLVNSNKNIIYHSLSWTVLFYKCKVGISAFDLQCTNLSFSLKDASLIDQSILRANKAFPDYNAVNPLYDVNESVDTVCFYITIVLIIFSFVATVISVLLLTICNYIYILEGRKEIALARCLGVNKKESQKFLLYHSLMHCLISFLVASIELIIISIIANFEIGNSLSVGFSFSFNPLSLIPMLLLSILISVFSSLIMSKRINRINPIDALKA